MISARRGLQEDFSKHGEVDGDDLLGVVVTLSECCSDLLLVNQTWQSGLKHKTKPSQKIRLMLSAQSKQYKVGIDMHSI